MKIKFLLALILLAVVSCAAPVGLNQPGEASQITEPSAQPTATNVPDTPSFTPTPTDLPSSTSTPAPTVTPVPPTLTPTPSFSTFALRDVAQQERGGVTVEIAWLQIEDRQIFERDHIQTVEIDPALFADKPVVGWLIFNIINNSGKNFHLHPRNATIIINEEEINLRDYSSYTSIDPNFNGTYHPGDKAYGGGVWFAISQSEVADIHQMVITMHGPHFYEEDVYAESYYMEIDLSDHRQDEFPDYLSSN